MSKSVTVKYIANYWRVCWCGKVVSTYDTWEEAEAAAASLRQSKAAGEEGVPALPRRERGEPDRS